MKRQRETLSNDTSPHMPDLFPQELWRRLILTASGAHGLFAWLCVSRGMHQFIRAARLHEEVPELRYYFGDQHCAPPAHCQLNGTRLISLAPRCIKMSASSGAYADVTTLARLAPTLTTLACYHCDWRGGGPRHSLEHVLGQLTNLRNLTLSCNDYYCVGQLSDALRPLTRLETLHLEVLAQGKLRGLGFLARMTALRSLCVNCTYNPISVCQLTQLTQLECVKIDDPFLHHHYQPDCLPGLTRLTNLRTLYVDARVTRNGGGGWMPMLPDLSFLGQHVNVVPHCDMPCPLPCDAPSNLCDVPPEASCSDYSDDNNAVNSCECYYCVYGGHDDAGDVEEAIE